MSAAEAGPPQPVRCPNCGKRQNAIPGGFDLDREPFGPVRCMVCRHTFSREEYLAGLQSAEAERRSVRPPAPKPHH